MFKSLTEDIFNIIFEHISCWVAVMLQAQLNEKETRIACPRKPRG